MQDNLKSGPNAERHEGIAADSSPSREGREGSRRPTASRRLTGAAKGKTKAGTARPASKQARVIDLLHRKEGTSIAAIMKTTGWQRHSVHGFLAGVVRRKLKLNLVRSGDAEKAIYRVMPGKLQRSHTKSGQPARKPAKRAISKRAR